MLDNYRLKKFLHIGKIFSKSLILLISLMLLTSERVIDKKCIDKNINNKYVVSAIVEIDIEAKKEENIQEMIEKEKQEEVLNTFTGDLTGYAADCPACYGTLGCLPSYNVYKNGILTYYDKLYGEVRIVASSKKIPCGSIIKFESGRVQPGVVYAIVLDRGVYNYDIDLLVSSESFAYQYIGRSKIKYDVLRYGW